MPAELTILAILAFIIGGVVLCGFIVVSGLTAAAALLLPILTILSAALIILFLFIVLPLSLSKNLRPMLGVTSIAMSHVLGATTWMLSFLYVIQILGSLGILLAFLFQLLAPIALVGLAFKGYTQEAGSLCVWLLFTFGMRFYGTWLLGPKPQQTRPRNNDGVIDVEGRVIE